MEESLLFCGKYNKAACPDMASGRTFSVPELYPGLSRNSSMHRFRAAQSKAQFSFRTTLQEFNIFPTHGNGIPDHSEFLLSLRDMPLIPCHLTA
jgi:hypothetical protein